jgi:hypothetical protein
MRILIVSLVLLFATPAFAQQSIAVDIAKAKLVWTWAQGTGGVPTEFRIKCGTNSGTYTKTTAVTNIVLREVAIATAISGVGTWFCVGTSANEFGESGATAEVSFRAGAVPVSMGTLVIQAQ